MNWADTGRAGVFAFLVLISIFCGGSGANDRKPGLCAGHDAKTPHVIETLEGEWARAYEHRDTALLNCILADDFEVSSMPSPAFRLHDKKTVLDWVATRTGSAELEHLQTRLYSVAAVARGVYWVREDGKLVSRFQFTDFFIYRDNRWQAISRILAELPVE